MYIYIWAIATGAGQPTETYNNCASSAMPKSSPLARNAKPQSRALHFPAERESLRQSCHRVLSAPFGRPGRTLNFRGFVM